MITEMNRQNKYSSIIEQIHSEFYCSGEEFAKSMQYKETGKSSLLLQNGFINSVGAKQDFSSVKELEYAKASSSAIISLSVLYPKYKFIPVSTVDSICKKYGLVTGPVSSYTGFVPERNIRQIHEFFQNENDINTYYYIAKGWGTAHDVQISKEQYEERIKIGDTVFHEERRMRSIKAYKKSKSNLIICAPAKDMHKDGRITKHKLFGKKMADFSIDDPIVLSPILYNEVNIFCVVTAWGDEASDPLVVNQINN